MHHTFILFLLFCAFGTVFQFGTALRTGLANALASTMGVGPTYLNSRHVTVVGSNVTAAADQTANGNNATLGSGVGPHYNASDAAFAGYPSLQCTHGTANQLTTTNAGGIAAAAKSFCQVGYSTQASGQTSWWMAATTGAGGCEMNTTDNSAPQHGHADFTCNAFLADQLWNTQAGYLTPGVMGACYSAGGVGCKVFASAQTPITFNGGGVNSDVAYNIGANHAGSSAGNMSGSWTDWLLYAGVMSTADMQYLQVGFGKIYGITIAP